MTKSIFIEGSSQTGAFPGNVTYSYKDGYLCLKKNEKIVKVLRAQKGDAFVVEITKGKAFLKKLVPPEKRGSCVAWLLGFNKDNRARSVDEYKKKLTHERNRKDWYGYEEWEYKSRSYIFLLCNSQFDNNFRNVAGFISDAISKDEILGLIPLMTRYPDWYVKKLLQERFCVTEEEFEEAKK